ncbi:unnamed protein product, partial [Adineta ricciae]
CAATMYSAKDRCEVLQIIAKRPDLSIAQFRVSVEAIDGISADNYKGACIKAFLVHEQLTAQNLDVILSAAGTMHSSGDMQGVFLELIQNRYLNAQHLASVLYGIAEISNDAHKSFVLCQLAPRLPKSDKNVREAYFEAADSIYSAKEKAAASMAFEPGKLPAGTPSSASDSTYIVQIQLATNISSDSEKAQVLKKILTNQQLSDNVIVAIAECAATMYSAKDRCEVLQIIAKRPDLSIAQFRVSVEAID